MNRSPFDITRPCSFRRFLRSGWLLLSVGLLGFNASFARAEPEAPQGEAASQQDLSTWFDATLNAFRGVAVIDWTSAVDLLASPKMKQTWLSENGNLFLSSIESEAFFAHSILLVSGQDAARFTGGIYNPWIDQWLLLDFVWLPDSREYQVSDAAWVPGGDKGADLAEIADPARFERRLRERIANAVSVGQAAAKRGAATCGGDRTAAGREASRRIRAYATHMRGALAPDGAAGQTVLRTAVRQYRKGSPSGFPVFWAEQGALRLVVFSSAPRPFEMNLASFEFDGRQMIPGETLKRDLSPKGGLP